MARVAKQGDYVFWTEVGGFSLKRGKLPDGTPEVLDVYGPAGSRGKLTVDPKRAYWTAEGEVEIKSAVRSTPLDAWATGAVGR